MAFIILAFCCFSGCDTQPPTVNQVEHQYLEYESDFRTVQNYLTSLQADSVYITNTSGNVLIDLSDRRIDDPLVVNSLQQLWKAGCSSIYMNRLDNSISFVLWKTALIGDAEAGVLYAIDSDGSKLPATQYLTELQPLSKKSWYYYIADYEKWRSQIQSGSIRGRFSD